MDLTSENLVASGQAVTYTLSFKNMLKFMILDSGLTFGPKKVQKIGPQQNQSMFFPYSY